jgi:Cdc6-like AAA superfamily ATPase
LVSKFKIHHGISDNIKDIESQVKKVKERYDRYNVHRVVANLVATTVDPRLLAMYNKVFDLVGIDEGANELMNNLFEAGDEPTKKIKTFSIVRFGGLGKTTLVKAVYDKVKKDFDCSAFVSIGLKCDPDKVFKDVLYDLDKQNHENIIVSEMDEKQLIDKLREFLADKRYTSYFMVNNTIFLVLPSLATMHRFVHIFMTYEVKSNKIFTNYATTGMDYRDGEKSF